jgi:alkenylglycerophosphocholine/alkenylglycerophosphoethanolamine hydrolase
MNFELTLNLKISTMFIWTSIHTILWVCAITLSIQSPSKWYRIAKPLPMFYLLLPFSFSKSLPHFTLQEVLILVGLVLGVIGDIALLKEEWFMIGLVSFLIGHICYIAALFVSSLHLSIFTTFSFVVFTCLYMTLIHKKSKEKRPSVSTTPFISYLSVISLMLFVALNYDYSVYGKMDLISYGAFLFFFSGNFPTSLQVDSVLFWHTIHPIPYRNILVLGSYFPAQALIALGTILSPTF